MRFPKRKDLRFTERKEIIPFLYVYKNLKLPASGGGGGQVVQIHMTAKQANSLDQEKAVDGPAHPCHWLSEGSVSPEGLWDLLIHAP